MTLRSLAKRIRSLKREYNARWGSRDQWPDYARARYYELCEQIREMREVA